MTEQDLDERGEAQTAQGRPGQPQKFENSEIQAWESAKATEQGLALV